MNKKQLLEFLPHRPPMLLLSEAVAVSEKYAESRIEVTASSAFFVPGSGVPAWVALEYMGQTAALIAGLQLQRGTVGPHVGFLLGTRKFVCRRPWFAAETSLSVVCSEIALVGDSLATFDCRVGVAGETDSAAACKLSVFRKSTSVYKGQS